MDDTGKLFWARVGTVEARLWTGAAISFFAYDSARNLRICEVVRHLGEVRRH
jgi:hypothetical protein